MKKILLTLLFFITIKGMCQTNSNLEIVHSSINVSGGNISNDQGSISFSIGQVFYSSYDGSENYIAEGVQQPIRISPSPIEIEKKDFDVMVYPNPFVEYFNIHASNITDKSLSYQFLDLHGRKLKEDQIEKSIMRVDISNLPVAVYLLRILENGEYIRTIKIIKK